MKTVFHGKRITGLLSVLPETSVAFEDEVSNYALPEKQTMRLKKVMGYGKHCISKPGTATSDLAIFGMKYLIQKEMLRPDDVGGLIVSTVTPDYFMPHVSNIVRGMQPASGCFLHRFAPGLLWLFSRTDSRVYDAGLPGKRKKGGFD